MDIWIVNHYALPPGASGGPTRHLGLAKALRDRGHDVTVVASLFDHYQRSNHRPAAGPPELIDGVRYRWIPTPAYGGAVRRIVNMATFAARLLTARTRAWGSPDVVIGSSPHLLAAAAAQRIAHRRGAGFVLEVRDLWPQSLVDLGEFGPGHPAVRGLAAVEGHLYRTADHVVVVPPEAEQFVVDRGAEPMRTSAIPNGVDLAAWPAPDPPPRRESLEVVYAGTIGLANGLEVVVDAAAILAARGCDGVRFRLVGPGPGRVDVAARAEAAGVSAMVQIDDPVRHDQVPAVLARADACLLVLRPSPVFRWGVSPTKLFDYMAAGRPIVSVVDAPPHAAVRAGAAVPVAAGDPNALADAVQSLAATRPDERWQMGMRGRRAAERHHDFSVLAQAYEHVLASAVDHRRSVNRGRPHG